MTDCSNTTNGISRLLPRSVFCQGSGGPGRNLVTAIASATRRRLAVSAVACLVMNGTANAEQNLPVIAKLPSELMVAAKAYPWSAVGKLNNGAFGACTAVLISRSYALTAAHCLFFRALRRYLPSESLHFILGYEGEYFADHLRVLAYYVPRSYDPLKPFESLASDWALMLVSGARNAPARPLAIASEVRPAPETSLMSAGYSGRRPHRMTGDQGCRFVGRSSDNGLLFDNCYAPEGFSGGPLLVENADKQSYSVAGIHVGNQAWEGHSVAIAVSAEVIWREIRPCVENNDCHFQHVASGRDPSAAEILSGLPNLGLKTTADPLAEQSCDENIVECGTARAGR
jgi:protease YdgD